MHDEHAVWAQLVAMAVEDGVTEWRRETEPGPLGTTVCLLRPIEGGYPGVVRAVAVVDGDRIYGAVNGASAAELLAARGLAAWDVPVDELVQLVRWITLGGHLVLAPPAPRVVRDGSDTLLYFTELDTMSAEEFPMVARFPASGRESVAGDEAA